MNSLETYFVFIYLMFFFLYPPTVYSLSTIGSNPTSVFSVSSVDLLYNNTNVSSGNITAGSTSFERSLPCGTNIGDIGSFVCSIGFTLGLSAVDTGIGFLNMIFIIATIYMTILIFRTLIIPLADAVLPF